MKSPAIPMAAALLAMSLEGVAVAQDVVKPITVLQDSSPVMYGRSLKLKAAVEAIDLEARQLTLKPAARRAIALHVDPRVKNLPEVKVGDEVSVRYYQAVGLSLRKVEADIGTEPGDTVTMDPDPLREAGTTRLSTRATVDAVDAKGKTVTIRDEGDILIDLYVRDAKVLDSVTAGDVVDVTYTEAAIVLVELPRDKNDDKKNDKKKKTKKK